MNLKDIFSSYRYKVELHAHTRPASGCAEFTADKVVRRYAAKGIDGIVIANHFTPDLVSDIHEMYSIDNYPENLSSLPSVKKALEWWLCDYYLAYETGKECGVSVYFGLELEFIGSTNHYVLLGAEPEDVSQLFELIYEGLKSFHYNYKREGSMLIWAHPSRKDINDINLDFVDAVEVFNLHPFVNSSVGSTARRFAKSGKPFTCGSDFHDPGGEAVAVMRFKSLPKTSREVADLIREGDYVIGIGDSILIP